MPEGALGRDVARKALELVKAAEAAFGTPDGAARMREAFDFLRLRPEKRLASLAHLVQPGAGARSIQAALVPLERLDRKTRITDAEMGIRSVDNPGKSDKVDIFAVADNVRSAFNMGGIFRTADFFGVSKVILCGYSPSPENPQVKKTALGADESVEWECCADIREVIPRLKAEGVKVYALETADGAVDAAKWDIVLPAALLLGNERFGLDPDVIAMADAVVEIPSHGTKNSLNVVSAFAVAAAFARASIARGGACHNLAGMV